jgi:hypothetical protein
MSQKPSKAARDAMFADNKKAAHKKVSQDLLGIKPYHRVRKRKARMNALTRLAGSK